ncbi:uncharacterized protein LOC112495255 [Cephus cinctus]|uniref:Uncharacterized protein LOC112495255 n=1 Tax=Cephus cinctus TaxID=211228 RepID=A0AAJ7RTH8_CEPCN|nr:uncharacterized protein LOC112495255 [Cephus cinctus]
MDVMAKSWDIKGLSYQRVLSYVTACPYDAQRNDVNLTGEEEKEDRFLDELGKCLERRDVHVSTSCRKVLHTDTFLGCIIRLMGSFGQSQEVQQIGRKPQRQIDACRY